MPRPSPLGILLSDGGVSQRNLRVAGVKIDWYSLLVLMVPALHTLWHTPECAAPISSGGLLAIWFPRGPRAAFKRGSESGRAPRLFSAALFLTTRFFFHRNSRLAARTAESNERDRSAEERYCPGARTANRKRRRKRLERIPDGRRPPIPRMAWPKAPRTPRRKKKGVAHRQSERLARHRVSRFR